MNDPENVSLQLDLNETEAAILNEHGTEQYKKVRKLHRNNTIKIDNQNPKRSPPIITRTTFNTRISKIPQSPSKRNQSCRPTLLQGEK